MDVNLEYYKIFYYVGKLGSITHAAESLHLSQRGHLDVDSANEMKG